MPEVVEEALYMEPPTERERQWWIGAFALYYAKNNGAFTPHTRAWNNHIAGVRNRYRFK